MKYGHETPGPFREGASALRRRLVEAVEMVDRVVALEDDAERLLMTGMADVAQYLILRHGCLDQEVMGCLYLDVHNRLIADTVVFCGTIVNINVEPRALLRKGLDCAATSMIVWHTHPSGDPTPSSADRSFTERLGQAGLAVGVRVLGHLIIGSRRRWVSLEVAGNLTGGLT